MSSLINPIISESFKRFDFCFALSKTFLGNVNPCRFPIQHQSSFRCPRDISRLKTTGRRKRQRSPSSAAATYMNVEPPESSQKEVDPADTFATLVLNGNQSTWENRRDSVRLFIGMALQLKSVREKLSANIKKNQTVFNPDQSEKKGLLDQSNLNAIVISVVSVSVGALVLRIGGRTLLFSVLGLNFEDSELASQIISFLDFFEGLGDSRFLVLAAAWVTAKTFMLDFLSVVLALTSGILFQNPFLGAFISTTLATVGSLPSYYLGNKLLKTKVVNQIEKRPALRALQSTVSENGFKTVLTLRLSPILPIPIGGYNYVYGACGVPIWAFLSGIFLGSFKPYLLDSFLGSFLLNPILKANSQGVSEGFLLSTIGITALVGTLATQLATKTWSEVQREVESQKALDANSNGTTPLWMCMWGIEENKVPDSVKKWTQSYSLAEEKYWKVIEDEHERIIAENESKKKAPSVISSPKAADHDSRVPDPPLTPEGKVDLPLWISEGVILTLLIPKIMAVYSKPEQGCRD